MRCKVGDLAVVIGGLDKYLGKHVEIIGKCPRGRWDWETVFLNYPEFGHVCGMDYQLIPIRPKDEPTTTERALEEA